MTQVKDIIEILETFAPPALAESYDNPGLVTGHFSNEVKGVLLTLDITEKVLDEALETGCNMVVAHHPVIFSPIKKLVGANYVERIIIKAIRNDLNLFISHTNIDHVETGVNYKIGEKLGLVDLKILSPKQGTLIKLVTFCPEDHTEKVLNALFLAGAGNIGKYAECSFSTSGTGTFKGSESSNPFKGKRGERHKEKEQRIEVILPKHLKSGIVQALKSAHPYEEVAYDLIRLENYHEQTGSGMIGKLEKPVMPEEFLQKIKISLKAGGIRYTDLCKRKIEKVAICGGSGSFLLKEAISQGADMFITGDYKYHQFFDGDGKIIIVDAGHFETEQFTPEIFFDLLKEKFSNFAVRLSNINTNPINYL